MASATTGLDTAADRGRLGGTEGVVRRWLAAAEAEGPEALRTRSRGRPPAKLTDAQKRSRPRWSAVAGVARGAPVPITRAMQRDDEKIASWRTDVGPRLWQPARRQRRTLVVVDATGFYRLPGVGRTYSPEGLTPVVYEGPTRDSLSVRGGVTPTGKVDVRVRRESLNGLHTVEFLLQLLRHAGPRLLVIWTVRRFTGGGGEGVPGQQSRPGDWGRAFAGICPRPESLGPRGRASSQACRDAQPGWLGPGGLAHGTPPGHWPVTTGRNL